MLYVYVILLVGDGNGEKNIVVMRQEPKAEDDGDIWSKVMYLYE